MTSHRLLATNNAHAPAHLLLPATGSHPAAGSLDSARTARRRTAGQHEDQVG